MIAPSELRANATAKLEDARLLLGHGRYDGCAYIGGYAIELALKARVCNTLKWKGFPESKSEFAKLTSFRTHDLEVLSLLSGADDVISPQYVAEWSLIKGWKPEIRYKGVGTTLEEDAHLFFKAVEILLKQL